MGGRIHGTFEDGKHEVREVLGILVSLCALFNSTSININMLHLVLDEFGLMFKLII